MHLRGHPFKNPSTMKPKHALVLCTALLSGLLITFLYLSLSGNKQRISDSHPPSNTARSSGYYELPQLIPAAWFPGQ